MRCELEISPGERRQESGRTWPLDGEHDEALVSRLEIGLLGDQEMIDESERLFGETRRQLDEDAVVADVDIEERHDLAVSVEEGGRRALPRSKRLDVVAEHALQEGLPIAAGDDDLAHIGAVDHADSFPGSPILGGQLSVASGKEHATRLAHRRSEIAMDVFEGELARHGPIVEGAPGPVNFGSVALCGDVRSHRAVPSRPRRRGADPALLRDRIA